MLNRIKEKLVMAFSSKNTNLNTVKEEPTQAPLSTFNLNLTKEEVEILLINIKDSTFKGEHVERVYNLVYKLQQYYISVKQ